MARTTTVRALAVMAMSVLVGAPALAQVSDGARQLFEAGDYGGAQHVIDEERQASGVNPANDYLVVQIAAREGDAAVAADALSRLAAQPDPTWGLVATSSRALLAHDPDGALEPARRAAAAGPMNMFAQYQLGLVLAERMDWAGAAAAFERAATLDPRFAYAHYYAGLSYSKVPRVDRTATYFERFLKLAPKAPERPAVESIMRTLRGR